MAIYQGGKKVGVIVPVVMKNKLPQVVDKSVTELTAEDLKGVTKIGSFAFYVCSNLTSITIPDSATSIENSAFSSCSGLTSITIPDSVTRIGSQAFYYCTSLTSVTIGSGVTSIVNSVFAACSKLTEMTILATTPPTLVNTNAISTATTTIYIPKGTLSAYQSATNWSNFADKFVELSE